MGAHEGVSATSQGRGVTVEQSASKAQVLHSFSVFLVQPHDTNSWKGSSTSVTPPGRRGWGPTGWRGSAPARPTHHVRAMPSRPCSSAHRPRACRYFLTVLFVSSSRYLEFFKFHTRGKHATVQKVLGPRWVGQNLTRTGQASSCPPSPCTSPVSESGGVLLRQGSSVFTNASACWDVCDGGTSATGCPRALCWRQRWEARPDGTT